MKYRCLGSKPEGKATASITVFYKISKEKEKYYKESMKALFEVDEDSHEIVYVVNGVKETLDKVMSWVEEIGVPSGKRVHIIFLDKNVGFARANNIGYRIIRKINPAVNYVALINDDLKVYTFSFKVLKKPLQIDGKAGGSSGIIYFWDKAGVWQAFHVEPLFLRRAWGLFTPNAYICGKPIPLMVMKEVAFPTWIQCGFSMFSVKAIEECGFLWHGFFLYGEDGEFSIRLWRCGYKLYYLPVPVAEHLVGGSGGAGYEVPMVSQALLTLAYGLRGVLGYMAYYVPRDLSNVLFNLLAVIKEKSLRRITKTMRMPYVLTILLEQYHKEMPARKRKVREPLLCLTSNPLLDVLKVRPLAPEDFCPFKNLVEFVRKYFVGLKP